MSKQQNVRVPVLVFGNGRTGSLRLSVGKRGRVVVKGDASFSLPEMRAIALQLEWFLTQVAQGGGTAPTPGTLRTPTSRDAHAQLSLPLKGSAHDVVDSVSENTHTEITN